MEAIVQLMSAIGRWLVSCYEEGKWKSTFLDSEGEFKGAIGFVADGEGNVLELALRVCDMLPSVPVGADKIHLAVEPRDSLDIAFPLHVAGRRLTRFYSGS